MRNQPAVTLHHGGKLMMREVGEPHDGVANRVAADEALDCEQVIFHRHSTSAALVVRIGHEHRP